MQSSLKLEPNPFEQSFKQGGAIPHASFAQQGGLPGPGASVQPAEDGKPGAIPGIDKLATPIPLIPGGLPGQPGMGNVTPGVWGFRAGQMTPSFLSTPNGQQNSAKFQQMLRQPPLPSPSFMGIPFDPQAAHAAAGTPGYKPGNGQSAAANGLYMLSRPPDVTETRTAIPHGAETAPSGALPAPLPAPPVGNDPVALNQHRHSVHSNGEFHHVEEDIEKDDSGPGRASRAAAPRKSRQGTSDDDPESDDRRKQFLERNRIAAIKCRRRKKQWVDTLKQRVDYLSQVNEEVVAENKRLRLQLEEMSSWVYSQGPQAVPRQIMAVAEVAKGTEGLGEDANGH